MSKKFYELEKREDGQIVNLIIPSRNDYEPIVISPQVNEDFDVIRTIIRAVSDFFFWEKYRHPLTGTNLHLYGQVTENPLQMRYKTNAGAVHQDYKGEVVIVANPDHFIDGWAQVDVRLLDGQPELVTAPFKRTDEWPDGPELRARKHTWINELILGFGFELRVLPINFKKGDDGYGYVDRFIAQWESETYEEAKAIRSRGLAKVSARRVLNAPVNKAYRQAGGAIPTDTEHVNVAGEVNSSIILRAPDGSTFDLNEVPVPSVLQVYDGRTTLNLNWDGSYQSRLRFEKASQEDFEVSLPKILK